MSVNYGSGNYGVYNYAVRGYGMGSYGQHEYGIYFVEKATISQTSGFNAVGTKVLVASSTLNDFESFITKLDVIIEPFF